MKTVGADEGYNAAGQRLLTAQTAGGRIDEFGDGGTDLLIVVQFAFKAAGTEDAF